MPEKYRKHHGPDRQAAESASLALESKKKEDLS